MSTGNSRNYDGKWGREIVEQTKRERERLDNERQLRHLHTVATHALAVIPGPWAVSEANFIVYGFLNADPETGKAVAEIDCYDEHVEIKTSYLSAIDPSTCLKLINLARKGLDHA